MKLVVIGGGLAGRTAAIEAAELGEDVTLIEMDKIGGKCLNSGCMVVCGLNDVARFVKNAEKFSSMGIIQQTPEINFKKMVEGIEETTIKLRGVNTAEIRNAGVKILSGRAEIGADHVTVDDKKYPYDKLIIATGSDALIPQLKGTDYAKTYKNILNYDEIPEKLIIVGSGVIATEFAGIFSILGSQVSVLCRNTFLKMLDSEIKDYVVEKILKDVDIIEHIDVTEIHEDGVSTTKGYMQGEVLLAIGMVPNSDIAADFVNIGKRGEIIVNEKMETSHPNIYAAGDVVGGIATTPVARMEGVVAARNACDIQTAVNYDTIPSSISLYYDVTSELRKTMKVLKDLLRVQLVPVPIGMFLTVKQE